MAGPLASGEPLAQLPERLQNEVGRSGEGRMMGTRSFPEKIGKPAAEPVLHGRFPLQAGPPRSPGEPSRAPKGGIDTNGATVTILRDAGRRRCQPRSRPLCRVPGWLKTPVLTRTVVRPAFRPAASLQPVSEEDQAPLGLGWISALKNADIRRSAKAGKREAAGSSSRGSRQ